MIKLGKLLATAAGRTLLRCAAAPAFAQTDNTTSQLLLRLKEKGILTEDDYNALVARKTVSSAPAQPAAVATSPEQPPQQAAQAQLDDKRRSA